eukprot:GEMP01006903.1.p1 GENE.GEMP01006903.1~~GEMP01006903.1.p1  ORF type:complete len:430 (+),score=69.98 GEMP01006903.1:57-1346(+)
MSDGINTDGTRKDKYTHALPHSYGLLRHSEESDVRDLLDELDLTRGDANSDSEHSSDYEVDLKIAASSSPTSNVANYHSARRVLLSWRLRPCYVIYCLTCLVVSAFLFLYTMIQGHLLDWNFNLYRRALWEEVLEVLLGISIVTETSVTYRVVGRQAFFRSKWCIVDLIISSLTVASWTMILFTSTAVMSHLEGNLEMPVLALRFGLQPMRVLSTFMALHKSRKMQSSGRQKLNFEMVKIEDDVVMDAQTKFKDFIGQILPELPLSLRFNKWYLAYSPNVHGISLHTMFRRLEDAGECIVLIRDHGGQVIGGLAPSIHRAGGPAHTVEDCAPCFVFNQKMDVFYYQPKNPMPPLYCDDNMVSFGRALTISSDMLHGSSKACDAYETLAPLGVDSEFVIKSLEIWAFQPVKHDDGLDSPRQVYLTPPSIK